PDGSECAGHLAVDVVQCVGEPGAQRPSPPNGTRPEIEDLPRNALVGLVDLHPVQAARVAEVAPDADRATLVVCAEGEQVLRPEGKRALWDGVVRELPGMQKHI